MVQSAVPGRRLLPVLLAAGALLTACSIATQPGAGVEVPAPEDVDWRRTVAGFEVLGVDTEPDTAELEILERAMEEMPRRLVDAAHIRRFYRVPVGESPHGTAAYALGPDIYLIDETFGGLGSGMSTFDLVRLIGHEMTHNAQFALLDDADLERASASGTADPIPASDFVASFADAVGWSDRGRASGVHDWTLTDPAGTTTYGATAPEEDMAESVAEVVTGTGPGISSARVRWVTEWLDTTPEQLVGGRPWVPAGSTRIVSDDPLYDPGEVQRRAAGLFTRGDGTGYWVEIWDFRNAPGFDDPPPSPVVTYVVLWR